MIEMGNVTLSGGWFKMGADDGPHLEDGEGPVRNIWLNPFKISKTAVSNKEFKEFIDATGYKTVAEEIGTSFVFFKFLKDPDQYESSNLSPIWRSVPNASWSSPEGANSNFLKRLDHPVVHISIRDALAFCEWKNCRLLTEAEWEYSARGGKVGKKYPWGSSLKLNDQKMANTWEGDFPNGKYDGFKDWGTVDIFSYQPNKFGLYNMIGNVWELVADRFEKTHSPRDQRNPKGPLNGEFIVARGGSYLCHDSYCARYRNSSRQAVKFNTTTGNIGFRIAFD